MNANNIMQSALELTKQHSKKDLAGLCRQFGWKGDDARTPLLQLAVWLATKFHESDDSQQMQRAPQPLPDDYSQQDNGQAPQGQQGQQQAPQQSQDNGGDGQAPQGQQESQKAPQQDDAPQDAPQGQQQAPQQAPQQSQDEQQQDAPQQQQQDEQQQQQDAPQQDEQSQPDYYEQFQQQQQQQQDEPQQDEQQQDDDEFARLLKASGITTPHRMLEKAWRLTAKAGLNLLLVGGAGSGKTMLSEQLAQLLQVPFSSVSCSQGMSESQLTGWLLPVGEAGRFDYVPSPFVRSMEQASVYLIDEMDGGDSNVFLVLNSITANGFITIPHKLTNPTVRRHADSILIAGANTVGNGGNDVYNARGALDGAFMDRWYTLHLDYDEAYLHGLFAFARKSTRKSAKWTPANDWNADNAEAMRVWFFNLMEQVKRHNLGNIVATRFAQKMIAAVKAGIPLTEVKNDLLMAWSKDERELCGVGA